ncbi:FMN-binding protein [Amphibacillus sp. Q70]|uniref:FMN-binding protein n=1 Tax=Amphibacillus sp. Q70 TaxID=3453416 RepID=UPI003F859214
MGKKTRLTIQILVASLFVMLLTVFLFTNDIIISEPDDDSTAEDVDAGDLEDGIYRGAAEGFNGPVEVEVTVENEEIASVTILDHSETEDISDSAFDKVPDAIVENNSTAVDVASGATITSEAIMAAVNNALGSSSASGTESEDNETDPDVAYEDGTYTGSADGFNEPIEVEVTVENGEIASVTILDHSETEDISDPAFDEVPDAIVESNSPDVDIASGATVTSEAIMAAVSNALDSGDGDDIENTDPDVAYEDGTYTASAEGYNGSVEVEVTVENSEIASVTILDHSETEGISDPAFDEVPDSIVENNSTDVDIASGASVTSEAIMAAVEAALEDAV